MHPWFISARLNQKLANYLFWRTSWNIFMTTTVAKLFMKLTPIIF